MPNDIPEEARLTDEEIGNLEWTETPSVPEGYHADFSFIDDYPKEVRRICDAQLEQAIPIITKQAREDVIVLLKKAVRLIKSWHNMGMPEGKAADNIWAIYYNNAPKMKEFREILGKDPSQEGG